MMKRLPNGAAAEIGDLLPFPILVLNSDLRVQAMNRAFSQTFGVSAETTENQSLFEIADGAWNIPTLRTALEKNIDQDNQSKPFEIDFKFTEPVQTLRLLIDSARFTPPDDLTLLILLTITDVTNRRRTENKVLFEEQVWDAIGCSVIVCDLNGVIIIWNRFAEMLYDWKSEEVVGRNISDIVESHIWTQLRTEICSDELVVQRRDGTAFPVLATITPLLNNAGEQIGIVSISMDITERKRSEEALRENEVRFRSFFEQQLIGMAITSPAKGVITINDKLCEMLDYSREELLQTTWTTITHPDDLAADVEQFNRVLAGAIDGYSIDKRFIRKTGQAIDVIMTTRCVRDSDHQVMYFVSLVQDITERKQATAKIQEQNRQLQTLLVLDQMVLGDGHLAALRQNTVRVITGTLPTAEVVTIWLDQPGSEKNTVQVSKPNVDITALTDLFASREFTQLVYRTSQPQNIGDVARELVEGNITAPAITLSVLIVPLLAENYPRGVLIVANATQLDAFNEDDLHWLQTLAARTSVILQNTHLFEEVSAAQKRALQLGRQVLEAQEIERERIARELHDESGQALTALSISLQRVMHDLPLAPADLYNSLIDIDALLHEAVQQLRSLALNLRPPRLDALDLNTVLADYCEDFAARTPLQVDYRGIALHSLKGNAEIHLYRFLQEALTNVVKHAFADRVWVRLTLQSGIISLSVEDDGIGFDPQDVASTESQPTPTHIGISIMNERLSLMGGWLEIDSLPGRGTRLIAHISEEESI